MEITKYSPKDNVSGGIDHEEFDRTCVFLGEMKHIENSLGNMYT